MIQGELMRNKTTQPSDCYVYLLSKAYQKGQSLVQKRLKKFGLTNLQYLVLEVLWRMEGITASETGKLLSIDKATLSGVIERMIDSQWVIKNQDENDKRVFQLYPSEKANQLKEVLINERKEANNQFLADFTIEERVLLRRLLLALQ
jgi:DNA-binding MarR family transcriptional regulator